MCNLEKFKALKRVLTLNEEQQKKIQGGGDPPPWPFDPDKDG